MEEQVKQIGLIAGSGPFPIIFAKKAASRGYHIYAVGYPGETDPSLGRYVSAMETIHLGQVGRLIKFFKKHRVEATVMVGAVKKPSSIREIKPDLKALAMFAGMRNNTHDDRILRAFAGIMEKEGIRVRSSTFLLPELLAEPGCWTKRRPTGQEQEDIRLGWKMAKSIGKLDIGQCVVVANGTVMAVEAVDGTDSTIRRGGALAAGSSPVIVKVCKPIQDFRFDVPAMGTRTIETMHEAGVRVLALEAGKSVVFEKDEMIALADSVDITIIALTDEEMETKNTNE